MFIYFYYFIGFKIMLLRKKELVENFILNSLTLLKIKYEILQI